MFGNKKRSAVFAVLCSISLFLSSVRVAYADVGDVACAIITFGLCEVTKGAGEDAAKALSDFKFTLKLENVDDIKRLLDSALDKTNRLLTTTGGELRETLVTANQQLRDSATLVDSLLGQRIDQLEEAVQRQLLWIAAYTDQLSKELDQLIRTAGEELRMTIGSAADNTGKVIALTSQEAQAIILRTSEESQKLLYAFDRSANGVVTNAGKVLQETIQLTGTELRYSIQTASGEIQAITKQISQEARVVLAAAEIHIENVIGFARDAAQQLIGDTTKNLMLAQDGVVFIVERMADLVLAIGSALLGLVLLFLAVNGWGRTLMRGRLPAHRGLRISAVTFMLVSLLVSVLPFIFLSKTARAYALARPYTSMIDQPVGLPHRGSPISSAIQPNLQRYEPNPVIIYVDNLVNTAVLTVTGANLNSHPVTATFGAFALEIVSLSTNELKVDLRHVFAHPEAANAIHIRYEDGTTGAVAVQRATIPTPSPTASPTAVAPMAETPVSLPALEIKSSANIRSGPGNYEVIGGAKPAERFTITGRSSAADWWRIDYITSDNQHREGWIWDGLVTVVVNGDVPQLTEPIYLPFPPPTPLPTPTSTPTSVPLCVEPSTACFGISSTSITAGEEITINWCEVQNAESVALLEGTTPIGVERAGLLKRSPQMSTSYELVAGYCGGQQKSLGQVIVNVATPTPTPEPALAEPAAPPVILCHDGVQGKIAWDYNSSTTWNENNVARLCRGNEYSLEPAYCFNQVMHGGIDWGGGTQWQWENAVDLCEGTTNVNATINCFQNYIQWGQSWPTAIALCDGRPLPPTLCHDAVQGIIAWDYDGSTTWNETNITRLCAGNEYSIEPALCFDQVMHGGINWGGGTQWQWENALNLCEGTTNAAATIRCFQSQIQQGYSWPDAIALCGR